jgi:hypothetical protein
MGLSPYGELNNFKKGKKSTGVTETFRISRKGGT